MIIKDLARLLISQTNISNNLKDFNERLAIKDEIEFMPASEFILSLITNLDSNLSGLKQLSQEDQQKFADVLQPFLSKVLTFCLQYLPYDDKIVNILDFEKILLFYFGI